MLNICTSYIVLLIGKVLLNGKAETALTPVEQFNVKMIAVTEKYLQDEKNSR